MIISNALQPVSCTFVTLLRCPFFHFYSLPSYFITLKNVHKIYKCGIKKKHYIKLPESQAFWSGFFMLQTDRRLMMLLYFWACIYMWLFACLPVWMCDPPLHPERPPSVRSLWGYYAALMVWFTNLQRPALLWNEQPRTRTVSSGQQGDWLTLLIDSSTFVCLVCV